MAITGDFEMAIDRVNVIRVDESRAADQFGLRQQEFEELIRNIIPGSGR